MGWITYILKALSFAPYIVHGIESLFPNKSGEDKKAMAMKALGFADGIADTLDPKHRDAYDAAERTVSDAVDGVVDVMNAANAAKGVPMKAVAANPLAPNPNPSQPHPVAVPVSINIPPDVHEAGRDAAREDQKGEPAPVSIPVDATVGDKSIDEVLDAGLKATAGHPNNPSPV